MVSAVSTASIVQSKNYVVISRDMFQANIPATAKLVYLTLRALYSKLNNNYVVLDRKALMSLTSLSRSAVYNALLYLKTNSWIDIEAKKVKIYSKRRLVLVKDNENNNTEPVINDNVSKKDKTNTNVSNVSKKHKMITLNTTTKLFKPSYKFNSLHKYINTKFNISSNKLNSNSSSINTKQVNNLVECSIDKEVKNKLLNIDSRGNVSGKNREKELHDKAEQLIANYGEYADLIVKTFEGIACTRKEKKMSISIYVQVLSYFAKYPKDSVLKACTKYCKEFWGTHKENYLKGVLRGVYRDQYGDNPTIDTAKIMIEAKKKSEYKEAVIECKNAIKALCRDQGVGIGEQYIIKKLINKGYDKKEIIEALDKKESE